MGLDISIVIIIITADLKRVWFSLECSFKGFIDHIALLINDTLLYLSELQRWLLWMFRWNREEYIDIPLEVLLGLLLFLFLLLVAILGSCRHRYFKSFNSAALIRFLSIFIELLLKLIFTHKLFMRGSTDSCDESFLFFIRFIFELFLLSLFGFLFFIRAFSLTVFECFSHDLEITGTKLIDDSDCLFLIFLS